MQGHLKYNPANGIHVENIGKAWQRPNNFCLKWGAADHTTYNWISLWSLKLCDKHGPRASVTTQLPVYSRVSIKLPIVLENTKLCRYKFCSMIVCQIMYLSMRR